MRTSQALKVLGLLLLGSLLGGTAFGAASSLITSKDIKDGSIQNRDIRSGVVSLSRLTDGVQDLINRPITPGPQGAAGAPGPPGAPGAPGGSTTPTLTSNNFGIIDRNTLGSPVAQFRNGPADPPRGTGSLNLLVGRMTTPAGANIGEKIAFGVTPPAGGLVSRLTQVSFAVYLTGEDIARGRPNMPSLAFEIDPDLTDATGSIGFTTLVFVPNNTTANQWTTIDATDPAAGFWFMTGRAGTASGCTQSATPCSFADVQARLPDTASIFTLQVTKGSDFEWQGAVDAVRVNNRIADFEQNGVTVSNVQ